MSMFDVWARPGRVPSAPSVPERAYTLPTMLVPGINAEPLRPSIGVGKARTSNRQAIRHFPRNRSARPTGGRVHI